LPLSDTAYILFTQYTNFNASFDIPSTAPHIPISSLKVLTTSINHKSGV